MPINLREIFSKQMRNLVDPIINTAPTMYEWWSMYSDLATLADRISHPSFVRHFKYPTIAVITNPVVHDDTRVLPARMEDNMFTGSTHMLYVEDPDLIPTPNKETVQSSLPDESPIIVSKLPYVNWVMKRGDKLVCIETGDVLIITDATPSAGKSHLMIEMIGISSLRTEYEGGTFDD